MNPFEKGREEILSYLKADLMGPRNGPDEIICEDPKSAYSCGILYPQEEGIDFNQEKEEDTGLIAVGGDENRDDPLNLANQFKPSSLGISFYVGGVNPSITIFPSYATYDADASSGRPVFRRTPFLLKKGLKVDVSPRLEYFDLTGSESRIWVRSRNVGEHLHLITVALINSSQGPQSPKGRCLFQAGLRVLPASSCQIVQFPLMLSGSTDPERRTLELLYRRKRPFAVGHGCAASWGKPVDCAVDQVQSEILPTREVAPVSFTLETDLDDRMQNALHNVHELRFLSDPAQDGPVATGLNALATAYERWIETLPAVNSDIPANLQEDAKERLRLCKCILERMRRGISLLASDARVKRAFHLANEAMRIQMIRTRMAREGKPDAVISDMPSIPDESEPSWRPFQLAFFLMSLDSVFGESEGRETVDLIWFPTGGGKTEAYFGVAAYTLFYERLAGKKSTTGLKVLMRYTLRALTTQQFQRASALICACEYVRMSHLKDLGENSFSLGLYVGNETSPGNVKKAAERYRAMIEQDRPENTFLLRNCPWCNKAMVPASYHGMTAQQRSDATGIVSTQSVLTFRCPDRGCRFHKHLPVQTVDEMLFREPPCFLIGTVDKFARLAWDQRAYLLFSSPPSLIIQDELHLISGPLGSIMGLYEMAIDQMCSKDGRRPKIIASTATIRRADAQCRALFDRAVTVFPSPGLDADDSFFARIDNSKPGRLYAGVLNPARTAVTSLVRTSAALLQATKHLSFTDDVRDNFFTLVTYFNSLRELGKARTLAVDDIPDRLKLIAGDPKKARSIRDEELTSNVKAHRIPQILQMLGRRWNETDSVDMVMCTNMISVGVDIDRLGLMLIVGQPKSTAEYIQCSSRVGRRHPGLVISLFSSTKPRDRSHYERFSAYHDMFYKEVEASSVTPYSKMARDRALHAALVILMRSRIDLRENERCGAFQAGDPDVTAAEEGLRQHLSRVDPLELDDTMAEWRNLVAEWERKTQIYGDRLRYHDTPGARAGEAFDYLIRTHQQRGQQGWPTMNSMRGVESDTRIELLP